MRRVCERGPLLIAGAILLAGCNRSLSTSSSATIHELSDGAVEVGAVGDDSNASGIPLAPPSEVRQEVVPPAVAKGVEGRVREATFDDIKFPMEKGDRFNRKLLTPQVEGLFGGRLRIRGYMLPALRSKGLKQFVLVRDNMECCFGPGAALYDCILVTMRPGKTAEYTIRPVAVEGVFDFFEHAPAGETLAIYTMEADAVE